MIQNTEQVAMKIERDLMVRSLDEWVMQTGAVVINSSWHSELQSLIEMAFDKGAEVQSASQARVPLSYAQVVHIFDKWTDGLGEQVELVRAIERAHGITQEQG